VHVTDGELRHGDVLDLLDAARTERYQLIISSPPYNIGKPYEKDGRSLSQYIAWQAEIVDRLVDLLEPTGSLCWQVGNYIRSGEVIPLDTIFIDLFRARGLKLRNRIIWRFNFGLHAARRFSGRYETLLWLTKSDDYYFNLDSVRIPQIYPGKRHATKKNNGKAGLPSGNPLGKNPSDFWEFSAEQDFLANPVWDVKANHPEKTAHPCQFPIELVERCVLALTAPGDVLLDPFVGTGTSMIAAIKHQRVAVGFDRERAFLKIAAERLKALGADCLPMRPLGKPIHRPRPNDRVSRVPEEWRRGSKGRQNGGAETEEKEKKTAHFNGARKARSPYQARTH
jgi:DNA modification methylase